MSGRDKYTFHVLTGIALLLVSVFAVWWFNPGHVPDNFEGALHLFDWLLFIAVSYVVWHPIVMNVLKWAIASHIKDRPKKRPAAGLKVAFITTFVPSSESIDLLERTLPAMVAVKYPHDTWLLDEGNSRRVREVCKKYGVRYFSRKHKPHYNTDSGKFVAKTKGGNHNSWHDAHGHKYDYVAQIDTDFVPRSDFLTKTLGYFKDPKVAFVGTPQIYGNTDSMIARGAAQQTYSFYGSTLRGLYGMDTTLLIGANHVIRTKALEGVGHYTAHITEDLFTGMKLHANGWKSVYVHEPLAIGEGPTTWSAYFNQQMRWAYGCVDILLRHSLGLLRKMNRRQRVYYFFLQQHYFTGVAMALGLVGLTLYFGFGVSTAEMNIESLLGTYIPVLIALEAMELWLQKYNIRPKQERGFLWSGRLVNIAVWPIFFMATIAAIRGKRLTYKVTPKGVERDARQSLVDSIHLFAPHIILGLYCLALLASSLLTGRHSSIMVFWATCSFILLSLIPFVLRIGAALIKSERKIEIVLDSHLEAATSGDIRLPVPPTDNERYSYFGPRHRWAFFWLLVSAFGIIYGYTMVMIKSPATWWLLSLLVIMVPPIVVNFWLRIRKPRLTIEAHKNTVKKWRNKKKSHVSVDIFLPSCGEELDVLDNTFYYVSKLRWPGPVNVYVLDDAALESVKALAAQYNFTYIVRPNRGELKKAGNLIHAFDMTSGDFILVFDADFVPRADFLYETLPYMEDPTVGVVQTAQYFDTSKDIGWIERFAGSLQEIFFRWIQPARDTYEAAICAGTNVIYRRKAVEAAGGFARAPIGEDVHSGVKIWTANYKTRYVQLALAKGLSPGDFKAIANQQYRWCRSSMLLMINDHFRKAPFSWQQRTSFWAAFLYYMSSALFLITMPLPTLIMIYFYPDAVYPHNYIPMIPAVLATFFVFPRLARGWSFTIYRQCMINSFCHILAITHALRGHVSAWVPSGAAKKKTGVPQTVKRIMVSWIILTQSLLWIGLSINVPEYGWYTYWPTILLGGVQMFMLAPLITVDYDLKATLRRMRYLYNERKLSLNRSFQARIFGGEVMSSRSGS